MAWTKNAQEITSIGDLAEYPKGFINTWISSVITLHSAGLVAIVIIFIHIYKKNCTKGKKNQEEDKREIKVNNIISIIEGRESDASNINQLKEIINWNKEI